MTMFLAGRSIPVIGTKPPADAKCAACHDTRYFYDSDGHGGFSWKRPCTYCR